MHYVLASGTMRGLLSLLFGAGFIAGLWSRRHGWFSGAVVGLTVAVGQMARWAGPDAFGAEWWRLGVPAAFVAAGMAILGGMTGAWLRDSKLQPSA